MGQRHQIYVLVKEDDKYTPVGAFHHQWCYGVKAVTSLHRAVDIINKTNEFRGKPDFLSHASDPRMIRTIITAAYGVGIDGYASMVHDEAEYLIEDGRIKPELGDNNDGCSLIIIDIDKNQARACFFTPGHVEGEYYRSGVNKAWSPEKYLSFYYSKTDQQSESFKEHHQSSMDFNESVKVKKVTQKELNLVLGVGSTSELKAV